MSNRKDTQSRSADDTGSMRGDARDAAARTRDDLATQRELASELVWLQEEHTDAHRFALRRVALLAARDRAAAALDRAEAALDRLDAEEYRRSNYRDGLTGALNRDVGRDQLSAEIGRARRSGTPLIIAFLDVKGLKTVNDTLGHPAGDEVLRSVGAALRAELREYDLAVRYGGDEFLCALPNCSLVDATARFEAVRAQLDTLCHSSPALSRLDVGFRLGLAQVQPGDTLDDVVERADQDLYARRRQESVQVLDLSTAEPEVRPLPRAP